jgi:hypothetical protein
MLCNPHPPGKQKNNFESFMTKKQKTKKMKTLAKARHVYQLLSLAYLGYA